MRNSVQHVVKQVAKFDGKNTDDCLEWLFELRVSLSLYRKLVFEFILGSQRLSGLDNDQLTICKGCRNAKHILCSILSFTTSNAAFSAVRRFKGKTRDGGVRH